LIPASKDDVKENNDKNSNRSLMVNCRQKLTATQTARPKILTLFAKGERAESAPPPKKN